MSIEEKIKQFREQKRYSQLYMANQLNISQSSYNKIENGQSQLSLDKFYQICKIFNISMDELYHLNLGSSTLKNKKSSISLKKNPNKQDLMTILSIVKEQENLIITLMDNYEK